MMAPYPPTATMEAEAVGALSEREMAAALEVQMDAAASLLPCGRSAWQQPALPLPTGPELSPFLAAGPPIGQHNGHRQQLPPMGFSLTDMIEQARERCSDEVREIREGVARW